MNLPTELTHLPPDAIYAVAGLLLAAEVGVLLGVFVPAASVLLGLGVLARTGRIDLAAAIAVAVVAALLGDSIGYWEGRLLADRIRAGRVGRLIGARRWQQAETAMSRAGGPSVAVGRWTAFVRTLVPRLAGAGGMRYGQFLVYNAAGVGVWTPGSILLGYVAGSAGQRLSRAVGIVVVLAGAVAAAVIVRRVRARRRATAGD